MSLVSRCRPTYQVHPRPVFRKAYDVIFCQGDDRGVSDANQGNQLDLFARINPNGVWPDVSLFRYHHQGSGVVYRADIKGRAAANNQRQQQHLVAKYFPRAMPRIILHGSSNNGLWLVLNHFNQEFKHAEAERTYCTVDSLELNIQSLVRFLSPYSAKLDEWLEKSTLLDLKYIESNIESVKAPVDILLVSVLAGISLTAFPHLSKWHLQKTKLYSELFQLLSSNSADAATINPRVAIDLDHRKTLVHPSETKRNVLITSALPYVNNVPHLGNIIGCVLSGDVFARYCRIRDYNTLYICGTDEYGTATETKAIEEGLSCQALCDKYFQLHKQTYEWFGIDFNHFGRTTTPKQTEISQGIFLQLEKNGHIFQDTVTQLYCTKHESFLADRFVEGTCPLCAYVDARGDQCDKCGKLINATELINPRCKLDGASPILRDSVHLFLNLTEAQPRLEDWFAKSSKEGFWSANSESITSNWLREGLKPRCITRDLKWGVKVPKVFYVWFDAPIGYPSITANYTDKWELWWKNPKNVKLYQFMGKDNVPFHTVIFPSTLMGTNDEWTLLHHLSTTEYLQYESGKFSKSRGVGVFGNNVVDSKIPSDVWRYYLLSIRPESSDSQFTWSGLITANNSELLANLGNFVNRVTKFLNAKYFKTIPKSHPEKQESTLKDEIQGLLTQYLEALEAVKIRQGLRIAMEISSRGNAYLQENKIDNALYLNSRERCDTVIATAANLVYLISTLIYPYLPASSASILKQLKAPQAALVETWDLDNIRAGHVIGAAEYIATRIPEERIEELRMKYSGQGAPSAEAKPKKKRGKAAPAKDASEITKNPEMIELEAKIAQQGIIVRQLKSSKGDAQDIKAQVDQLLLLKGQLDSLMKRI